MYFIFGLVVLISSIRFWGDFSLKGAGLAFACIIGAGSFMGVLLDYAQNVWTPKRRKKYYNQAPLNELLEFGFRNIENSHFAGVYKGYAMLIIYDHSFSRTIVYEVFYKPVFADTEEEFDHMYNLLNKNRFELKLAVSGKIVKSRDIRFKMPHFESILEDMDKIVSFMNDKGIEPLTPRGI